MLIRFDQLHNAKLEYNILAFCKNIKTMTINFIEEFLCNGKVMRSETFAVSSRFLYFKDSTYVTWQKYGSMCLITYPLCCSYSFYKITIINVKSWKTGSALCHSAVSLLIILQETTRGAVICLTTPWSRFSKESLHMSNHTLILVY